ncbi:MAG TPA: glycerol kinase GlpK [Acidimicrobiia bacterium]|nr:glycerol kinase GlpK [Acidimicrobiia bacterium]
MTPPSAADRSGPWVLALDAGTTGVRVIAFDEHGRPGPSAYREFPQYFPQPGWVEHDAVEIWAAVQDVLGEVAAAIGGQSVAAIGITNQRETTVVWDRRTGEPRHRAIVWQDRRTAERCDELKAQGAEDTVRKRTGLVLDPYFSGTKLEWLLTTGRVAADEDLAFGTVDTWLLWKLTGGADGGVHATDPSNASRTLLYDIGALAWSDELLEFLSVPRSCLPDVLPSSGRFGVTARDAAAGLAVPVSGIAGDQQAALFGQACFHPGMTKNTYGTGSFVLMNVGDAMPAPVEGLLTTVAWQLSESGSTRRHVAYALEGAIFVTGAAIQWLRDGLGVIADAAETGPLAQSVESTDGVYFVPAFTGLGSPYWDPYARGTIVGLTRGTSRAHLARAVVEAMAYQTRDVVEAMRAASGTAVAELRADGGASVMNFLCQFQADLLGVPVRRPQVQETTALGAAYLAGLAEGVWGSTTELSEHWLLDEAFQPRPIDPGLYEDWRRAVERARAWDRPDGVPS